MEKEVADEAREPNLEPDRRSEDEVSVADVGSDNVDDICDDTIAAAAAAASSVDGVGSQELGNYLQNYMGRRAAAAEAAEPGSVNVYDELRQKEQDLLLAAELGRALLCSNAQLKDEAELLRAEFEARLAASEREKADLRGKMDAAEQDWDAQLRDLQAEIRALREELRRQQLARSELLSANERLVEECRLSASRTESLQSELRARRAEAQDRLASVSAEVNELRAERAEMERRLGRAGAELDALAAMGEEQRARLESRLAELTDNAADLRERLAASLASQRRQQMELAEEQLFQQQQSQLMSPSNPSSSSAHLVFMSTSGASISSLTAATPTACGGGDSGVVVSSGIGDCLGESLFSELGGFGATQAGGQFEEDEDIEEDEAAGAQQPQPQFFGSSENGDGQLMMRQWDGPDAESLVHLVHNLQSELQLKNQQLEEKCCDLQRTQSQLNFQQRQTEALLANESAMKRDQKDAVEKRICLETQLSRMKAEVERLNSELNIGDSTHED